MSPVLILTFARRQFANGANENLIKETQMADTSTNPKGLLSFVYHVYYDIDNMHNTFMSESTTMMVKDFGLSPDLVNKILGFGRTDQSDEELAQEFADLLKEEFIQNRDFRNKIW